MSIELTLPEDETKMLKWLFSDGFEFARRRGEVGPHFDAMQRLEPIVLRLRANQPVAFEKSDIAAIDAAVTFGQVQNSDHIVHERMVDERSAIDRLKARLKLLRR